TCDVNASIISVVGPVPVLLSGGNWVAQDLPQGCHVFTYVASDCCGNTSSATITVSVIDKTPPVPISKEFIVVSLTHDGGAIDSHDEADQGNGVAKIYAEHVNNGSYDNCTDVYFEVRREDGSPACLNYGEASGSIWYNNNLTFNDEFLTDSISTKLHANDNILDTDHGQFVKFCCEDVGNDNLKVILRVWDDANGSGVFGDMIMDTCSQE